MTASPTNPSRARLLLADDDRLILATLDQCLRAVGYQVVAVDSGEAALTACGNSQFDLAILDIRMPGLSGIELARRLRERHDLGALFLSAYSDEATVAEAVREGGLGYLVKPLDPAQLAPAVEVALARVRDLRTLRRNGAQMEQALAGSRVASIAIGVLMERHRIGRESAQQRLRDSARGQSRRLEDVASELVDAVETLNRIGGE